MLLLIAWRNVWRNKKRSLILLGAIVFGIWAGVFTMGFTEGMYDQMVETGVSTRIGHLQIHTPGYRSRPDIHKTLPDGAGLADSLRGLPGLASVSGRSIVRGMASSPKTAYGVQVTGVNPADDAGVFDVHEHLVGGDWFETQRRNPVVIGRELADRLDVGVGKKLVVQAQASDGSIGAAAFRVVGVFETASNAFDETTVFALRDDVDRVFGLGGGLHEIAVRLNEVGQLGEVQAALQRSYPGLAVETWREVAPELAVMAEMGDQMLYVFLILILLGLVFGITNTILMGVLERVRELGVLKALGMKDARLFGMIMLETVVLSLAGGCVGILAGMATISFFGKAGIDLSIVSQGLGEFGLGSMVYPTLEWPVYLNVAGLVVATALLSALYPGVKAVRLKAVEAIRTY